MDDMAWRSMGNTRWRHQAVHNICLKKIRFFDRIFLRALFRLIFRLFTGTNRLGCERLRSLARRSTKVETTSQREVGCNSRTDAPLYETLKPRNNVTGPQAREDLRGRVLKSEDLLTPRTTRRNVRRVGPLSLSSRKRPALRVVGTAGAGLVEKTVHRFCFDACERIEQRRYTFHRTHLALVRA